MTCQGSWVVEISKGTMSPTSDSIGVEDIARNALALIGSIDDQIFGTNGRADKSGGVIDKP